MGAYPCDDTEAAGWRKVSVGGYAPETKVVNLKPARFYHVRVRARNKLGFSLYSPAVVMRTMSVCGDRIRLDPEQCDDGGLNANDGCSKFCEIELGWTCSGDFSYVKYIIK